MLLYDAHARAYTLKRNHFLEFLRIVLKFGFFEKKTYVHVNLSDAILGSLLVKNNIVVFVAIFFIIFASNRFFAKKKTGKSYKSGGGAEISTEISARGA